MPLTGKYNNIGFTSLFQWSLNLQRRTELASVDASFIVEKEFFSGACLICGAINPRNKMCGPRPEIFCSKFQFHANG